MGAISEPVETTHGIHLIQLLGKQAAGIRPFDEVKSSIIATLEAEYRQIRKEEYFAKIRSREGLWLDKEQLNAWITEKKAELETKLAE
ncbi:MAG: hypothetical protein HQL49_12690 [Gammaproteobacteria bacterium]|nr:hypothetical protein [Gammaproteobacteria bacterium]